MISHLATFLVIGLETGGLAVFLRRLPVPDRILDWRFPLVFPLIGGTRFGDKPWGCPVCMAGWSGFVTVGTWPEPVGLRWFPIAWLVAVAVGSLVFTFVIPPPPADLGLDDLDDHAGRD